MSALDYVPNELLYEQYADPLGGIGALAKCYGVSSTAMYRRLNADPQQFADAQAMKAYRLHETAIAALFAEPERIVDAAGSSRIDPAWASHQKSKCQELSRIAGILHTKLSERHQVDVTHSASPLADYIARIAAGGSSVPIAPQGITRIIEGDAVEVEDVEPLEQGGAALL